MVAVHVFLLRHGETALNAAGVLRGQLDVPLDETGKAQAAALGEVFRDVPLSAVVSSPLSRAVATARPVAHASGSPLAIDDRLTDRFYGQWAGHSLEQVEQRFGSIDSAPLVEAWQVLETRTEDAFRDAVVTAESTHTSGETARLGVAIVAHDAVLRALFGRLLPALSPARLDLPTGSWSELVAATAGKQWKVLHLGELAESGRRPDLSPS
ncbi:MAG: histidine phosphatase family protein [Acidimicrobiales bacterium]